ncbi:MAG: fused MFS/spermidine synthase [Deltaproteobacteria bacterium]|nr:fused MFS/spermidine synthase [Deltaproteobacteria bacterium]
MSAAVAVEEAAAPQARQVLLDERSAFQRVFVVEEDGLRVLRFDAIAGNDQSAFDPSKPDRVVFEYVRLAGLALKLVERPQRALVIGLGGGAFPRLLLSRDDKVVVDAVEIDPVVIDASRRFFRLPASPRLHVHTGDGVAYIARARAGYDIVLLDAFSAEGIPASLSSKAFFADARRVLAERGVAVMNLALVGPAEMELITQRFAEAFPGCVVVTGKAEDNRMLFGARVPVAIDGVRVAALMSSPVLGYDAHADVEEILPCPMRTKIPKSMK